MFDSNESISLEMKLVSTAKQTPCAKDIIWSVHNISKPEREDGLKIRLNHAKERASPLTGISPTQIAVRILIPPARHKACEILVY